MSWNKSGLRPFVLSTIAGALAVASTVATAQTWDEVVKKEAQNRILELDLEAQKKSNELEALKKAPLIEEEKRKREEEREKERIRQANIPAGVTAIDGALRAMDTPALAVQEKEDRFILISVYGSDDRNLLADVIYNGEVFTVSTSGSRGANKLGEWRIVGISERSVEIEKKDKDTLVPKTLSFKSVALAPVEGAGATQPGTLGSSPNLPVNVPAQRLGGAPARSGVIGLNRGNNAAGQDIQPGGSVQRLEGFGGQGFPGVQSQIRGGQAAPIGIGNQPLAR